MKLPLITILLAVKNGSRFIKEQIDSILAQDYPHIALYVRDNNSSDSTRDVVRSFGQRVTLITSDGSLDAKGNFSKLMEAHSASYTMLSDCDDVWLPTKVSMTFEKMMELENELGVQTPLLVHTDLRVVDANLNTIAPSFWRYSNLFPIEGRGGLNRQLMQNTITGHSVMVNRPLLYLALPIPPEAMMHDWWLGLVATAFGAIGKVDAPTSLYRQHNENDTGAKHYGIVKELLNWRSDKSKQQVNMRLLSQAIAFSSHFADQLSEQQLATLAGYQEYLRSPPLLRVRHMVRHRLYKCGWLRTLKSALAPSTV